jgi:hypothetical protein
MGQDDAAFGSQLFNISIAQATAKVEPDAMADDLCREAIALIQASWWWSIHAASMPHEGSAGKGGD